MDVVGLAGWSKEKVIIKKGSKLLVSLFLTFVGLVFCAKGVAMWSDRTDRVLGETDSAVGLSEISANSQMQFKVNVPAVFMGASVFEEVTEFLKDIAAPNVIYFIKSGNGVSVSSGQVPTISNTGVLSFQSKTGAITLEAGSGVSLDGLKITNSDTGSSQSIFKKIAVSGQTDVEADENSDTLTIVGAGGASITTDATNDKITITTSSPDYTLSGWTDSGITVSLTTVTDAVLMDSVTFGDATVTNGNSILPDTDLGSDLGSSLKRFNNLWVSNINSSSSQSFSGKTVFTYAPTDTTISEASVLINPTTSVANGQLLGFSMAGYQRALIDAEGDLVLGYNSATSAPANAYPLSIFGHSGTEVAHIDASGNQYIAGNVGIGTTNPSYLLSLYRSTYENVHIISIDTAGLGESFYVTDGGYIYSNQGIQVNGGGIYNAANYYGANTGSDLVLIDSAKFILKNGGNVGIGITNPAEKLAVNGAVYLSDMTAPSPTTNRLYSVSGSLYWNGTELGVSGGSLFTDGGAMTYLTSTSDDLGIGGTSSATTTFLISAGTGDASSSGSLTIGYNGQIKSQYGPLNLAYKSAADTWTTGLILQDTTGDLLLGGVDSTSPVFFDISTPSMSMNSTQVVRLPVQATMTGSIIFGNGGTSLAHSATTDGYYNTLVGLGAGNGMTTGYSNTLMGYNSGYSLTTNAGRKETLIGAESGYHLTFGRENVMVGYQAGYNRTTGNNNTFIGHMAGYDDVANVAFYNTYVGNETGRDTTGSYNTALGLGALSANSSAQQMVAIGYGAGGAIGNSSSYAILIGYEAGEANNAQNNVFIGYRTANVSTTGSSNVIIGGDAADNSTVGNSNNVMIGYRAGKGTGAYTTATNNVFLGYQAGYSIATNSTGNVLLGYQAGYSETGSEKLYIENSDSTSPLVYGDFSSDIFSVNGKVGIGTTTPTTRLHVSGSTLGKSLVIFDETSDMDLFTASAGGVTKLTVNHNGLLNATAGGLATFAKAGTISDADFTDTAVDGLMGIDTTNHRIYFREGDAWSFAAKAGGFQIPNFEVEGLSTGDYLIPYAESFMADGAVHGMYRKFSEVKNELLKDIYQTISDILIRLETIEKRLVAMANDFVTRRSHQEELCVGKDGEETCLGKDQIDGLIKLLPSLSLTPSPTITPEATPEITSAPTPTAPIVMDEFEVASVSGVSVEATESASSLVEE